MDCKEAPKEEEVERRQRFFVFSPKWGEEGWRNATPKCFYYVIIYVYIQGVESLLSCFFHVVDDDVDVDVDDPSQETEAKRTVAPGVDLHSQFSSCYCLTIPAVASKTSQVSRSPMIPEVPSA